VRTARTIWLSLLAAGLASAELPETHNRFAVVLSFEEEYSEPTLEQMQRELEYILSPVGFAFQWRMGPNDRREEIANFLVSVRMTGRCALLTQTEQAGERFGNRVLGHTEMTEGRILSYCEVDCDGVRGMIRSATSSESFVQMQNLFGRALGRVLAHEVFHILSGTTRHRREGVSKAVVTPEELVDGVVKLELEEVEAIYRNLYPPASRKRQPVYAGGGDGGR
jgi:hypothetical protein